MKFGRWMLAPLLLGLAGWTLACAPSASAVTITNVSAGDNFFSPIDVTINVNDKVKWTWIGFNQHTVTSDTGLWDSGLHGTGFTFTNTFTAAGRFPYHCTVHANVGSVTVQTTNAPPIVLSNPQRVSDTQFQFDYTANAGLRYVIQRSDSLTNFTAINTNTATGSSVTFTDSAATLDSSFYRVGLLPSP